MKGNIKFRRRAAVLACFLSVYAVLSLIPDSQVFSARAAAAYKSGSDIASSEDASGPSHITPTASSAIPASSTEPSYVTPTASSAVPESSTEPSYVTPTASSAVLTSSAPDSSHEITLLFPPDIIALDAGQADGTTWKSLLPDQAEARTAGGDDIFCGLDWSVARVKWDQPGLYLATAKVIPPDGYTLSKYVDNSCQAIVSIHPPGQSQIVDVYASMGFWMLRSHTWTFAMKAGQDMTPLIEKLESMTDYYGIIDTSHENVHFTASWDFSGVDPDTPGLYYIYRSLSPVEEDLPVGLSPEDLFLSDYWKNLPVLFSVEEPGGPQLYGVLENPYDFFGSYAKLSDEELDALEVWYSIDGSPWKLQTDEGLMETEQTNFLIHKSEMETGRNYSFRLQLGDHTSRELTVQKKEDSPVWFTWMLNSNRDGTIDIDFPDISQPPPETTSAEETTPSESTAPTGTGEEGTTSPGDFGSSEPGGSDNSGGSGGSDNSVGSGGSDNSGGSGGPDNSGNSGGPDNSGGSGGSDNSSGSGDSDGSGSSDGSGDLESSGDSGNSGNSGNSGGSGNLGDSGNSGGPGTGGDAASAPGNPVSTAPETSETKAQAPVGPSRPEESQATGRADEKAPSQKPAETIPAPAPEEIVTRWTSQISGKRVKKLLELYPEWILFQKEDVSVLLSSEWLEKQQLKDSDTLTVKVSSGADRAVTILINQKAPKDAPVFQVKIEQPSGSRTGAAETAARAATVCLFLLGCSVSLLYVKRRWKK